MVPKIVPENFNTKLMKLQKCLYFHTRNCTKQMVLKQVLFLYKRKFMVFPNTYILLPQNEKILQKYYKA